MFTPPTEKCNCGFNHLTEKAREMLFDDAAVALSHVIRDLLHDSITLEQAKNLAIYSITVGQQHLYNVVKDPTLIMDTLIAGGLINAERINDSSTD